MGWDMGFFLRVSVTFATEAQRRNASLVFHRAAVACIKRAHPHPQMEGDPTATSLPSQRTPAPRAHAVLALPRLAGFRKAAATSYRPAAQSPQVKP